ncbi:MAG: hypothetical protein Q4B71_02460 [Cardiobacteriaceae bacterium]|nr:hypothetical protein [Cardiobacteriaceae bacterium]
MKRLKRDLWIWAALTLWVIFDPDMHFGRCQAFRPESCTAGEYDGYYWAAFLISTLIAIIYRYLKNPSDD